MLKIIAEWIRPPAIRTSLQLEDAIITETARVAQKATTGYCRTKAGVNVDLLFKEAGFLELLEICRWDAHALVLMDMILVAEGFLRPAARGREDDLAAWLLAFYDRTVDATAHPERGADGWQAQKAEMRERLARSRLAQPIPAANVGFDTAQRIYDSLPVHPHLRRDDFELVQNLMRFGHVSFREDLEKRANPQAVIASLPAGSSTA